MSQPPTQGPIDVKIGMPNKVPSQDPQRAGKFDLVWIVEYGPFSRLIVTLPEETASLVMVQNKAREEIMKLKGLGNVTFQV